ncbi:MAG: hypothetical protein B0A82_22000 [Alkalinema sp. CACIAM 70d]|nr:MAG: hypothetical protein B0A82_22000 [Alkalinema sp. CACIAM 70d]
MNPIIRIALICTTTIAPGLFFTGYSAHFLLLDWQELDRAVTRLSAIADGKPTVQQVLLAKAAEDRHRINCFAEGVGVLLGWTMVTIGIHGLCGLPHSSKSFEP